MPGILLNILQCMGQAPTTKVNLVPNVKSAELEKLPDNGSVPFVSS